MKLRNVDIELVGEVLSITQNDGGRGSTRRNVQMVQLQPETAAALTRRLRLMEMEHG